MTMASQIIDFFNQNVVEFDGKIVSSYGTIKRRSPAVGFNNKNMTDCCMII